MCVPAANVLVPRAKVNNLGTTDSTEMPARPPRSIVPTTTCVHPTTIKPLGPGELPPAYFMKVKRILKKKSEPLYEAEENPCQSKPAEDRTDDGQNPEETR